MMPRKRRIFIVTGTAILVSIAFLTFALPYASRRITAIHQNNVIRELNEWADEYSIISDHDSAVRAADMLTYISTYYVPNDGYRSDAQTERRLKGARAQATRMISDAIAAYTGDDSVTDPLDWVDVLRDHAPAVQKGG